jgi:hypothetical protein
MKPHEPAPLANQDVSRDATEQLSGDWHSHVIDFDGPGFLEYERVGIAQPCVMSTRRAFELRASLRQRRVCSLEVVLTTVPFHGESLSGKCTTESEDR